MLTNYLKNDGAKHRTEIGRNDKIRLNREIRFELHYCNTSRKQAGIKNPGVAGFFTMRPEGIEPPSFRLEGGCLIR